MCSEDNIKKLLSSDVFSKLNVAKLSFQVSLENKAVTIDGYEKCVETAIEQLDYVGFDVVKQV